MGPGCRPAVTLQSEKHTTEGKGLWDPAAARAFVSPARAAPHHPPTRPPTHLAGSELAARQQHGLELLADLALLPLPAKLEDQALQAVLAPVAALKLGAQLVSLQRAGPEAAVSGRAGVWEGGRAGR